jgi:hypothetical protein
MIGYMDIYKDREYSMDIEGEIKINKEKIKK